VEPENCDQLLEYGRAKKIESLEEFYPFYLCEHSKAGTKLFHFLATFNVLYLIFSRGFTLTSISVGLLQGYGLAWISHFCVESNQPATFTYPAWSFRSDWLMFLDSVMGRCRMW